MQRGILAFQAPSQYSFPPVGVLPLCFEISPFQDTLRNDHIPADTLEIEMSSWDEDLSLKNISLDDNVLRFSQISHRTSMCINHNRGDFTPSHDVKDLLSNAGFSRQSEGHLTRRISIHSSALQFQAYQRRSLIHDKFPSHGKLGIIKM